MRYSYSVSHRASDISIKAVGTLRKTINGIEYVGSFEHTVTVKTSDLRNFNGVYTIQLPTTTLYPEGFEPPKKKLDPIVFS